MMRRLTLVAALALLSACGQSGSNLSEDVSNSLNVLEGDVGSQAKAANAMNSAGNSAANSTEPGKVLVGGLPLRLGYYVSNETACESASKATVTLIGRNGYSGARYSCTFGTIEKTGATTYRVTETCREGDAIANRQEVRTSTRTYDVTDAENYAAQSDSGWANKARYCPQSSLPAPWKDEDMRALTGAPPPEKP
ncbi:hypothetical protein M2341_001940 [Sphingobium sp. B7D2B]|uniref:hypothetical protein n=1 Tax=Sphingobium sp. B7D2B TaxID=2940583 RepID=UPI002225AECF|nr:hypothetical protein [Sphingobium sp. B7D2B]MCW2366493.1 hypothetical protein [Sphingobium sp. B7D2B]